MLHFSDDLMAYVAFNRGFKSGIFNIAGISPGGASAPPAVKPEILKSYTTGFKSEFFHRTLRLNVEGFYYDYTNIQVFNITPTGTLLLNGGKATIKGVDIDSEITAGHGLKFTFGAEFQKGRYDSFKNGPTFFPQPPNQPIPIPAGCPFTTYPVSTAPTAQLSCDLSGRDTIQTPAFSFDATVDQEVPLVNGNLTLTVTYAHRDSFFIEPDNSYTSRQPKTDQVNVSTFWVSPSQLFNLRLWCENLTNEKSYSYLAQSTTGGTRYAPRPPRTYGFTVGVRF